MIVLVRSRTEVEEALALLSTIGGAYSCLGERDVHCVSGYEIICSKFLKFVLLYQTIFP